MKQGKKTCGLLFAALVMWGVSGAWAGDGVVALQTAAASCADPTNTDRYIDCGNGTVTDNNTGLVWLKQANCLAKCSEAFGGPCTVDSDCGGGTCDPTAVGWVRAMEFVAGLSDKPATSAAADEDCGLSDGSSPGEWRLPSVEEWEAMTANAVGLGCRPTITNDAGDDCWDAACVTVGACSFSGVSSASNPYWSASTSVRNADSPWGMYLGLARIDRFSKDDEFFTGFVWPVRGGQ